MAQPQRMQVSRRKGFNLQDASLALNGLSARLITRPGKWGNPFSIDATAAAYGLGRAAAQAKAVDLYAQWLIGALDAAQSPGTPPTRAMIVEDLGGHNLACWCKPGTPCHADVLLAIANP